MNHLFYKKGFTPLHFSKKSVTGFTVVEMLIVLAIFMLIGFAAVTLQVDVFQKNRQFSESLTSVQEARSALKKMVSEIRIANSANTGAYPIAVATPTEFSFYADTDNNNIYDRIRYFYSNGSLMRGVIVPTGSPLTYNPANETTSTLTHNVTNSGTGIFFYHNDLYTGTEVPLASPFNTSDIRVVRIVLSVDASTSTPPGPITEESAVFIRTFKTGS